MNERQKENLGVGIGATAFMLIFIMMDSDKLLLVLPVIAYFLAIHQLHRDKKNKEKK